jgi:ribosome-binding protein aMBF1 (putative translation factor)
MITPPYGGTVTEDSRPRGSAAHRGGRAARHGRFANGRAQTTAPREIAPSAGVLIAAARLRHGMSQRTLAQRLCAESGTTTLSRHEISRWEREVRLPSGYWRRPLSAVLRIDRDELEHAIAQARERRARIAGRSIAWPWRVIEVPVHPAKRGGHDELETATPSGSHRPSSRQRVTAASV